MFINREQLMVTSCIFSGNQAGYRGGAIAGGGTLTNCTISSNSANNAGGGIFCGSSSLLLTNCIFWANSVGGLINESTQIAGGPPQVTFSCIQDDDPNDGNIPFGDTANGNIDDNPMFVRDPNDGGDGWGVGNNDDFGDPHLETGSPCINSGDPNPYAKGQMDIDGQPRIMGQRVDMGADEFLLKTIVVTKPQGKEIWAAGSSHIIAWESQIYTGGVDVLFSQDSGSNWQTIKTAVPCTGTDLWQLPDDVDSNQCVLSAVPTIPDANIVCIHSGLFTIHPDSIGPAVDSRWKSLGGNFERTGLIRNYGPQFGCVLWQFKTPGALPTSVTVGLNDRVHIACEDGKLYTLDPNGSLLWSYDANSPLTCSPTIGPDGSLYVGSTNGKLHAISPDGKIRWTHNTDGPIYSSPAVSPAGNVCFGSGDGKFYALGSDGSELWTFQTAAPGRLSNGAILASPAIGADGTVYIGGLYDPNLYALDPNDGSIKWVCNFGDPCKPDGEKEGGWPFASPVVGMDGTIYQTLLYDSNLYAIEPNDGAVIWKTNLADPLSGWFDPNYAENYGDADGWSEPALGPDGTIYVSFDDPYLRAVEPNGSIKWVMPLGTMGGFTLAVGNDGFIYAACDDSNLYVVDVNGWEIARFQSDDWLNYPVIARDNLIILTDANDKSLLITDTNNTVWAISQKGCRDLNFDGVINFNDIALLAEYWLECTDVNWPCNYQGEQSYLTGDVDANKYVGFSDLALIADLWRGSQKLLKPSPQPGPASNPSPPNGSINVLPTTLLSWTAGSFAVLHNVYFGTASPPPFVGSQTYTTFKPGQLALATTYYWRIDEVNPMGTTTGELWRFTTRGKMIVCFPADTLVWVDGTLTPISKATPGQPVGKPNCALLTSGLEQIEKVEEHQGTFQCYDIALENGDYISVADSHCFMLDCGQWAAVQDLKAGSKLKSLNGPVSIKSVTKRQTPLTGKVYNLKVKDSDRYFVGKDGIIVCDY
jgi:predicted outer membrane repeat protein